MQKEGTYHFTWYSRVERSPRTNTLLADGQVGNLQQILLSSHSRDIFNKISLLAFRVAIGGAADRGAGTLKVNTHFYRCSISTTK
jgi:hypothetical protein